MTTRIHAFGPNGELSPGAAAALAGLEPGGGGGSTPDATDTVKGVVQLTNHLGGTATAPTVRAASTTQTGIVELATNTEATTGTDTARAVTPSGVKAVVDARATDYATAAQGAKADAAIPSGLVDAKGDLIVATADNTVTRLPAGTNGHVLTADSAQAAGVKWAAASGGAAPPPRETGQWLTGGWTWTVAQRQLAISADRLYLWPYYIDRSTPIERASLYVSTASASGKCRVGIATMDSPTSGTVLHDFGEVSTDSSGDKAWLPSSVTLDAGYYWLLLIADQDFTIQRGTAGFFSAAPSLMVIPYSTFGANPFITGRTVAQTYAAFSTIPAFTPQVNDSISNVIVPVALRLGTV